MTKAIPLQQGPQVSVRPSSALIHVPSVAKFPTPCRQRCDPTPASGFGTCCIIDAARKVRQKCSEAEAIAPWNRQDDRNQCSAYTAIEHGSPPYLRCSVDRRKSLSQWPGQQRLCQIVAAFPHGLQPRTRKLGTQPRFGGTRSSGPASRTKAPRNPAPMVDARRHSVPSHATDGFRVREEGDGLGRFRS